MRSSSLVVFSAAFLLGLVGVASAAPHAPPPAEAHAELAVRPAAARPSTSVRGPAVVPVAVDHAETAGHAENAAAPRRLPAVLRAAPLRAEPPPHGEQSEPATAVDAVDTEPGSAANRTARPKAPGRGVTAEVVGGPERAQAARGGRAPSVRAAAPVTQESFIGDEWQFAFVADGAIRDSASPARKGEAPVLVVDDEHNKIRITRSQIEEVVDGIGKNPGELTERRHAALTWLCFRTSTRVDWAMKQLTEGSKDWRPWQTKEIVRLVESNFTDAGPRTSFLAPVTFGVSAAHTTSLPVTGANPVQAWIQANAAAWKRARETWKALGWVQ